MCRLIVFNVVRPPADEARLEAGRYQQGMVVCVLEDDQDPGSDIWTLGYWRVIDIPGVAKADMEYLGSSMPDDIDTSKIPRKRANLLDLNVLPIPLVALPSRGGPRFANGPQGNVADDAVIQPEEVDLQTIIDATILVDYVDDPAQIGPDPQVIG